MTVRKFLCVCEGGTIRSVSLALQLKHAGQDALAGSWRWNSPKTFSLLCDWADYVVVMQAEFSDRILAMCPEAKAKLRVVDVGPDVYGNPLHLGLSQFLQSVVEDWKARDFRI